MIIATINVIIKSFLLTSIKLEKLSNKKPNQLVMGPGKTGKKLPTIPKIISPDAMMIKKTSINYNFCLYSKIIYSLNIKFGFNTKLHFF